ncbi:gamma-glutamyl-gamma-aminobutyrate hydrolase family protein [Saccharophagus degradans]|uniref:Type 1 glutamine amidotransferase n=1 Tax=Saccharophagus degradans TaxID=86304 RepID=A0AAW7X3D0_9GAMM|nr:type 1 glutamine amidotransferase [Saccharophagus degradans]MDO6422310.1 type 1 glutamine amidotransferase [Saccharophagus degradans]MDO6608150.1 type 1 glutamine amidotransferase [Saccharophagus degradans]
MTRPLIVVTGPGKKLKVGWWATKFILWLCGARSCYLSPTQPELLQAVDGVVIGGGDDIDPEHYGESGDAGATYDAARDSLEIAMIKAALQARVPLLGICRGAQLINVVLKGSLFQDIRPLRRKTPNKNSAFVIKKAYLQPSSQVAAILGKEVIGINSLHSQAVNKLSSELQVAAVDRDDFVQAFEHQTKPFIIGVQWHPEYLPYYSCQRNLFHALVAAVSNQSKKLLPEHYNQYHIK